MKAKAKGLTPIVREAATGGYRALVEAARGHDPGDSHVPGLLLTTIVTKVSEPSPPTVRRGVSALVEAGVAEYSCGHWRVIYGKLGPRALPVHCMNDEELMRLARIGIAAGLVLAEEAPLLLEVVELVALEVEA